MRLAILPICTFSNLKGESVINNFTRLVRHWVDQHDDLFVYMALPAECEDQGWELDDHPQCAAVWETQLGLYYDQMAEVPKTFLESFNPRIGHYTVDALITSRRVAAGFMARQMWDHRLKDAPPIFIDESMTVDWDVKAGTVSEVEILGQVLGYAYSWPIWDTWVQQQTAINACRRWLSGSATKRALEKGTVIPAGFDPRKIDSVVGDGLGKYDRFTCFFGGRLNTGTKRADVMLREYDSLFRFGRDVDITICSPKDEGPALDLIKNEYPEIEVKTRVESDQFIELASRSHVYFSTSAHEGFSVGFCEMMYLTKHGTVVIAPNLPWVKGLMEDAFEDYPLLYDDLKQARAMLRWVYDNYEEAVRQTSWLGDVIAEKYDVRTTAEQHYQHIRSITDDILDHEFIRGMMGESTQELALEALKAMPNKRFGLWSLYEVMITRSRAFRKEPRRGQPSAWVVRRWLLLEGYAQDTYDTVLPEMEKV